jgi:hypothetical protein
LRERLPLVVWAEQRDMEWSLLSYVREKPWVRKRLGAAIDFYTCIPFVDPSPSSDMPSFSQKSLHLTAYEQAFVFPHAITALGSTPTKFRISSKDLIGMLSYSFVNK